MKNNNIHGADLSIIVVAFNVKDLVAKCLECIRRSRDTLRKEIIYVENGSTDGTLEMVQSRFPEVKVVATPVNLGFIKANNLGFCEASGKYILLLNSDCFIREKTLQGLVDFMESHADCGVAGCNAEDAEGNPLPSARYFPTPWRIFLTKMGWAGKFAFWRDINDATQDLSAVRECDWVTGCCLLVRKEIVDTFDFFLRPQLFMYNDDNDLCFRVKQQGWKVYCLPETVTHLAGATNKKVMRETKDLLGIRRLTLESDYIYFRQNYNFFWALKHFLLMTVYETVQVFKNILLKRDKEKTFQSLATLKLTFQVFHKTRWGSNPLERDAAPGPKISLPDSNSKKDFRY